MALPYPSRYPRFETDSSMMMTKALHTRKIQERNGNFHATYVYPEGKQVHETGITGGKKWMLLFIIIFMIVMAIANLLLSAAIIYVLRFDFEGMQSIEMVSPDILTRFVQDAELEGVVAPYSGVIDSLPHKDLVFTSEESEVKMEVEDICTHNPPSATGKDTISVSVQEDGIKMVANDGFHVISPQGEPVFTTDDHVLDMPWIQNVSHIELTELVTSKIFSPRGSSLHLESDGDATIQGMLGLSVHGNQAVIVANKDVHFRSQGTGLKLSAPQGVYFEKVKQFRRSSGKKSRRRHFAVGGNSICVCGNSGRVFIVPDKGRGLGCANANEHINPCE